MKQSNTWIVGDGDLYSGRMEVRSFHVSSVASDSLFGILREFSVQLWSVNQWTMEAEEVTDS
jgi:hypothetical protein